MPAIGGSKAPSLTQVSNGVANGTEHRAGNRPLPRPRTLRLWGGQPAAASQRTSVVSAVSPDAVDEAGFVPINGADQWLVVRGKHRDNPVLLFVGGDGTDGPGAVLSPFVQVFAPLEDDFTIALWDPRGAGKSFVKSGGIVGPDVTIEQIVTDGIAVAATLERRFHKRKVVVVGVNFGSTVATLMALRAPALFSAYVGTGQIVTNRADRERLAYQRGLRLATAAHDVQALDDLRVSGPSPFREPRDPARIAAFLRAGAKYRPPNPSNPLQIALAAPHWTPAEIAAAMRAPAANEAAFGRAWGESFDFKALGPRFAIPVFVIQGDDNDTAPTERAREWLARVTAPQKEFYAVPVAGNHVLETHPLQYLKLLKEHVRPLAVRAE